MYTMDLTTGRNEKLTQPVSMPPAASYEPDDEFEEEADEDFDEEFGLDEEDFDKDADLDDAEFEEGFEDDLDFGEEDSDFGEKEEDEDDL